MSNVEMFIKLSNNCSKQIAKEYSTSFFSAINLLDFGLRQPVFNIYGFVRLADEIVDTFHDFDKTSLLEELKTQTYNAIENGISLNPVLQSFQQTVNEYKIEMHLIDAFFYSMHMDLTKNEYTIEEYKTYIYGSAEVVGLMCLKIFCNGDNSLYQHLASYSKRLGSAFQKINFLRDIKSDNLNLQRMYFPNCDFVNFSNTDKAKIESDIQLDFDEVLIGIKQLPISSILGVYVAYEYYFAVFSKIKSLPASKVANKRIRVSNFYKLFIVVKSYLKFKLKMM